MTWGKHGTGADGRGRQWRGDRREAHKAGTYIGNPPKDVRMEAHVVLRDVQAALDEDFALQGTAVVWASSGVSPVTQHEAQGRRGARTFDEVVALRYAREQFVEVLVPLVARHGEPSDRDVFGVEVEVVALV